MKDANLDINLNNTGNINTNVDADQELSININDIKNLGASFSTNQNINIQLNASDNLSASFSDAYIAGECKVLYNTTENWNRQRELISKRGYIYIYSDYKKDEYNRNIAAFKVGDGSTYLIDLPIIQQSFFEHLEDTIIHITQEEREFWNNKVRCYEDEHSLIFTTH